MRRGSTIAIAVACMVVGTAAREASACTLCDSIGGVALVVESPNQPANAGFFVWDVGDPEGHVEVWVDGVPADVERIDGPELQLGGPAILARVVPTPEVGSMVYILGHPSEVCFGEDLPDEQGFVAGPVDDEAPANLVDSYWDLHLFDFQEMIGCTPDFDGLIYVRGVVAAETPRQAARILEVEVQNGPQNTVQQAFVIDEDGSDIAVRVDADDLGAPPFDDLCVRVTVSDATGLRSAPGEWSCRPCHRVVSPPVVDEIPDEPAWSDDDLVPDGHCGIGAPPPPAGESSGGAAGSTGSDDASDGDAGTAGGDDATSSLPTTTTTTGTASDTTGAPELDDASLDRGCACTTTRSRTSAWLVLLLPLVRRRRQSARSATSSRIHGASSG